MTAQVLVESSLCLHFQNISTFLKGRDTFVIRDILLNPQHSSEPPENLLMTADDDPPVTPEEMNVTPSAPNEPDMPRSLFHCNICDFIGSDKAPLQYHMEIEHDSPRPYRCDVCSKTFMSYNAFRKHQGTHPSYGGKRHELDIDILKS